MNKIILSPFIICSVEAQAVYRVYADRERWQAECLALGATIEQVRVYDADAQAYARTTLYPNSDVVAYARRLAVDALRLGLPVPESAEQAIEEENTRAMARFLAP
jgi:hypothetical protein